MSRHRKHRDYRNYDDLGNSNYGSENFGSISSLLGNIDINQIASLLSSSGILNNLNSSNNTTEGQQKESIANILSNVDIGQLLSQASSLNNMMNNSEVLEEEPRERHSKSKNQKERNNVQRQSQQPQVQSQDSIVVLLNAIKPLVTPDRGEIINRIIDLYVQGKI